MPPLLSDFQFGPFRLSPSPRRLTRDGAEIPLTPKALETLAVLTAHPGEVIEKQDLMKAVWGDVFVDDSTLTQNIFTIRKALGEPSYIETVPKRGYRFTASISPAPTETASHPAGERRHIGRWTAAAASLAVVASVALLWGARTAGRSPAIRSIAVLPLANLSGDPNQEYFSDGTTEALISSLAQIHALDVTSRTSIMRFKGTTKPLQEIGKELGVDAIVEGSVRRSGSRVRISTQLIRTSTDKHLWANEYEGDGSDVLKLQSEIAQAIAREIQVRITPEERRHLISARAVNPEAEDLVRLGRYHYWRNNFSDYKLAIDYLNRAIASQPDNADAYAELSDAWGSLWDFEPTSEVRNHAYVAARRALELDPDNSNAHAALGAVMFIDMEWTSADREFRRSLELNPDNLNACGCYVNLLAAMGRFQEAIDLGSHAVTINPLSSWIYAWYGSALYNARRYQEAIPAFQRAIELDSGNPAGYKLLSLVYLKLDRVSDALSLLERPEFRSSRGLAVAYAQSGRKDDARAILRKLTSAGSGAQAFDIAALQLALGDRDQAFEWLGKAIDKKETGARFLKVSPSFDDVRADPRFQALVARLNIPD